MAVKEQGIVTQLEWARQMLAMSSSKRKQIVKDILNDLKCFRKPTRANQKLNIEDWQVPTKEGKAMVEDLKKNYRLVGFIPNVIYTKVDSNHKDELGVSYCHPFSMHTLLYAHKTLPISIIVNPLKTHDESYIFKIDGNEFLTDLYGGEPMGYQG